LWYDKHHEGDKINMNKQKRSLSIHDISCVGRCSLTVALPILSAAGMDSSVLPTAVLSTHTGGFEGYTFRDLSDDIQPISAHWQSLNLGFDALYSGFLGSFEQIDLLKDLFDTFKTPDNLIMVDPVMGDHGKMYPIFEPAMADGMASLCAKADIIVPNLTEASLMLHEDYVGSGYDETYIKGLLQRLSGLGADLVVLTGVSYEPGKLGAASYDRKSDAVSYACAGWVPGYFHGSGDVFSSALLSALMHDFSLERSIEIAVRFTFRSIQLTVELGQERRYGICFERALPELIKLLGLSD
jgi:pyridoxine kinase